MRDMQMVLERWGAWAADNNNGVDYPPIAAGFKGLLPAKKSRVKCCDEDGLILNSAVKCLKEHNEELYDLVVLYYIRDLSLRKIGGMKKRSYSHINHLLNMAESFIDGCLTVIDAKLDMDHEAQISQKDKYGDRHMRSFDI